MCIAALKLLSDVLPDAEFSILSLSPELDQRRYGRFGVNLRIVPRAGGRLGALRGLMRQCASSDLVVGVYGDAFVTRTVAEFADFIAKMLIVTLAGKPVVVFPASMGPFDVGWRRFLTRGVLNRMKLIAAREDTTRGHLAEAGIKGPALSLVPDLAFALPVAAEDRLGAILRAEGLADARRPLVGMHASKLQAHYCSHVLGVDRDHIAFLASAADWIITTLDATVVLFPYVIWPSELRQLEGTVAAAGGDDLAGVREVLAQVEQKDRVVAIETDYDAIELKGLIGRCDLFIGHGMHSNIAAISMGVPTIAIDFRYKTPAMMKMVDLEDYYCDLRTVTPDELRAKIDALWLKRKETRLMLESRMHDFAASIQAMVESVRVLVDSGDGDDV